MISRTLPVPYSKLVYVEQCSGFESRSGSTGSTCYWASRIRIHYSEVLIRILLSSSKNSKKKPWFLLFCDFFWTFYLWKWCKCTFKSNKQNFFFLIRFMFVSWRSMTKIAGSGSASGSISQRQWSADLDPHQNVMDFEQIWHWLFQTHPFSGLKTKTKEKRRNSGAPYLS